MVVSQFAVDVQIHSFENSNNIEKRDGLFCCCDATNDCAQQPSDLPSCIASCDSQLTIALTGCDVCPGPCCAVLQDRSYMSFPYNFSMEFSEGQSREVI